MKWQKKCTDAAICTTLVKEQGGTWGNSEGEKIPRRWIIIMCRKCNLREVGNCKVVPGESALR